jgi:hypothetical protein
MKKATCANAGSYDEVDKCKNCGAEKAGSRTTETIEQKAHTPKVTIAAKAATCTEAGNTQQIVCEVCGTVIQASETIPALGHSYVTKTTKKANAETKTNGTKVTSCTRCGNVSATTTISYPKTITLSATKFTYTGKVQKPTITVKDAKGSLISSSNYTLKWASGCKKVGSYTVTVTFKGDYSGSVSKTFKIVPKGTTISSVTAKSKAFTVKWKQQTTGYQIQYATNSSFTNATTVKVSKNTTVTKTISKLTANKKYYVRIRTYSTVSGTNYYSAWSGVKNVTTKK